MSVDQHSAARTRVVAAITASIAACIDEENAAIQKATTVRKPAMAVDTHVFRVAGRIGLSTGAKNPYETEMQLIKYIPEEKIPLAHHWLILHGRYICTARKPSCENCGVREFCRYVNKKT